jgi:hypothetical protein
MITDTPANDDHPQTIKAETDARGSALFRKRPEAGSDEPLREDATALPADALGEVEEAARRDSAGAETIGDALASSRGEKIGSGTQPDENALAGGEPPTVTEDSDPLGSYRPGESRE